MARKSELSAVDSKDRTADEEGMHTSRDKSELLEE